MIGNMGKIACKGWYHNIKLSMDAYKMKIDMNVLPLGGYDIVLSIQWLITLAPNL